MIKVKLGVVDEDDFHVNNVFDVFAHLSGSADRIFIGVPQKPIFVWGTNIEIPRVTTTHGTDGDDLMIAYPTNSTRFYGHDGNDVLVGSTKVDFLHGDKGDDVLIGLEGDDYLTGGAGADLLIGNIGTDMVDYSMADGSVFVSLADGVGYGSDAHGDKLVSIESLLGSAFADWIKGSSGDNVLTGWLGADLFALTGGNDRITDFRPFEGDRLSLAYADRNMVNDVIASAVDDGLGGTLLTFAEYSVIEGQGEDAVTVVLQEAGTVHLTGVPIDALNSDWFA